jgi:F-type H+-transporting ATPase subunit b
MDLSNKILNSFSIQVSDISLGLNPDIFESNVINIAILLGGVIYLGGNALSSNLDERQQNILDEIKGAEICFQQTELSLETTCNKVENVRTLIKLVNLDAAEIFVESGIALTNNTIAQIEILTGAFESQIATIESKTRQQILNSFLDSVVEEAAFYFELRSVLDFNWQKRIFEGLHHYFCFIINYEI